MLLLTHTALAETKIAEAHFNKKMERFSITKHWSSSDSEEKEEDANGGRANIQE